MNAAVRQWPKGTGSFTAVSSIQKGTTSKNLAHNCHTSGYSTEITDSKHFYPTRGELEDTGKEFDCAQVLDNIPRVKHWVRNLSQKRDFSFWLPNSTVFLLRLRGGICGRPSVDGGIQRRSNRHHGLYQGEKNIGGLWERKMQRKGFVSDGPENGRTRAGRLQADSG